MNPAIGDYINEIAELNIEGNGRKKGYINTLMMQERTVDAFWRDLD
jgi:hypothetical protein